MNDLTAITEDEMVAQLRRIITGEVTWEAAGTAWNNCYASDCAFLTSDGWRIVVFNYCDEFDYIDHAIAPDGRRYDYQMSGPLEADAVSLLTDIELATIEHLAEEAPVAND